MTLTILVAFGALALAALVGALLAPPDLMAGCHHGRGLPPP